MAQQAAVKVDEAESSGRQRRASVSVEEVKWGRTSPPSPCTTG
jgi:hypothetical protein